MYDRIKERICLIIIIVIFLSGINVGYSEIDMPCFGMLNQEEDDHLMSNKMGFWHVQFAVADALGTEDLIMELQVHTRGKSSKLDHKELQNVAALYRLEFLGEKVFWCFKDVDNSSLQQEEHIKNYIHKTDGKKRC